MRDVLSIMLLDWNRIRRSRVRHIRHCGFHVNDHILQPSVADFDSLECGILGMLLAVRIGRHLNLLIGWRRSFKRNLTAYRRRRRWRASSRRSHARTRWWKVRRLLAPAATHGKRKDENRRTNEQHSFLHLGISRL